MKNIIYKSGALFIDKLFVLSDTIFYKRLSQQQHSDIHKKLLRYALYLIKAKEIYQLGIDLDIEDEIVDFKKNHIDGSAYALNLWRGVYACTLEGKTVDEASIKFKLHTLDIRASIDFLTPDDIDLIRRNASHTDLPANFDMAGLVSELLPLAKRLVYTELSFIATYDDSFDLQDLVNDLLLEAVRSVAVYIADNENDSFKLKNYAIESVKNQAHKLAEYYSMKKRARIVRTYKSSGPVGGYLELPRNHAANSSSLNIKINGRNYYTDVKGGAVQTLEDKKCFVTGPYGKIQLTLREPLQIEYRQDSPDSLRDTIYIRGNRFDLKQLHSAFEATTLGTYTRSKKQDEFKKIMLSGDQTIGGDDAEQKVTLLTNVSNDIADESPNHAKLATTQYVDDNDTITDIMVSLEPKEQQLCRLIILEGDDDDFLRWCSKQGIDHSRLNHRRRFNEYCNYIGIVNKATLTESIMKRIGKVVDHIDYHRKYTQVRFLKNFSDISIGTIGTVMAVEATDTLNEHTGSLEKKLGDYYSVMVNQKIIRRVPKKYLKKVSRTQEEDVEALSS